MKFFTVFLFLFLFSSCKEDHSDHKNHDSAAVHALKKSGDNGKNVDGEACHHNLGDGDHGHHHGPGGHTHGDYEIVAPNGGALMKLGGDAAVLEMVINHREGTMAVYFYDGLAEEQLQLEQTNLKVAVKAISTLNINLKADEKGVFRAKSDIIKGLKKFEATVGELEIDGLPFDGTPVYYPEGN